MNLSLQRKSSESSASYLISIASIINDQSTFENWEIVKPDLSITTGISEEVPHIVYHSPSAWRNRPINHIVKIIGVCPSVIWNQFECICAIIIWRDRKARKDIVLESRIFSGRGYLDDKQVNNNSLATVVGLKGLREVKSVKVKERRYIKTDLLLHKPLCLSAS